MFGNKQSFWGLASFSRLKTPSSHSLLCSHFLGYHVNALSQIMFKQKEECDRLYSLFNFFFLTCKFGFIARQAGDWKNMQSHSPICTAFKSHYNFEKNAACISMPWPETCSVSFTALIFCLHFSGQKSYVKTEWYLKAFR